MYIRIHPRKKIIASLFSFCNEHKELFIHTTYIYTDHVLLPISHKLTRPKAYSVTFFANATATIFHARGMAICFSLINKGGGESIESLQLSTRLVGLVKICQNNSSHHSQASSCCRWRIASVNSELAS